MTTPFKKPAPAVSDLDLTADGAVAATGEDADLSAALGEWLDEIARTRAALGEPVEVPAAVYVTPAAFAPSEQFLAQEAKALRLFAEQGVVVRTDIVEDPAQTPQQGCTCTYHAYDAAGEYLDGGAASVLLDWHNDGYFTAAYLVPRV